ncbi:RNA-binding cell elongation regulator Jag/EloR [Lacticaseibacillus porcinae]|uniref:RNA-binding cell elongation regulator Jag/EloR n=1 Tax=Lacticaseibacillus porcinae TaxID=1123687 RepID=UPI000F767832|nr:RNA-binding cell elongation regulator Jag/EloR [Lacticaseibacillus porcinae]
MPTFQGTTIQKAIDQGLQSLGVARDAVSVDVIQEGKKGLFGLGKKAAIVNLKPLVIAPEPKPAPKPKPAHHVHLPHAASDKRQRDDQTAIALVQSYLEDIIRQLQITATIDSQRKGDKVWFDVVTDKEAQLIGKHGKIINAIQYLAQTEFNRYGKAKWTIMVNVGDYRERRDAAVKRLAQKTARDVVATGAAVYLDPMPAFERKAIHSALSDNAYVETHSEGVDPRRYVVITPARH